MDSPANPPMRPPAPLRLAFVCVENSCRSPIAEGFARLLGGDRVEAHSAGSRPSARVHPGAVASMRRLGVDLSAHRPKSVDELRGSFDAVVTLGCGDSCPHVAAKRRFDWEIPDPKELPPAEFDAVRDLVESKVKELLEELR